MGTAPMAAADLAAWRSKHPSWTLEQGQLVRTFEAFTFMRAIAFVTEVARVADAADHHPDIDIRFRRVTLRFVTHDAGQQVTELDTRLAAECELLFAATP